jgi:hypothetical protein
MATLAMAENRPADFAKPKFIEGGCLCSACRYRVEFPSDHDFKTSVCILSLLLCICLVLMAFQSGSCQCTQCRKQTGAPFYFWHRVLPGFEAFKWTTGNPPAALKTYKASPKATRYFCGSCGSFLIWKRDDKHYISFPVGTVDALYLIGEGSDGQTAVEGQVVPKDGFGTALMYGGAGHEFCKNTITGITDQVPFLYRGPRFETEE